MPWKVNKMQFSLPVLPTIWPQTCFKKWILLRMNTSTFTVGIHVYYKNAWKQFVRTIFLFKSLKQVGWCVLYSHSQAWYFFSRKISASSISLSKQTESTCTCTHMYSQSVRFQTHVKFPQAGAAFPMPDLRRERICALLVPYLFIKHTLPFRDLIWSTFK